MADHKTLIQLTRLGQTIRCSKDDLGRLRAQYARENYIRFPRFFHDELLEEISRRMERARYRLIDYHDGAELCMRENDIHRILLFMLNSAEIFRCVEKIAVCGRIRGFSGRVYQARHGRSQGFWHTDLAGGRTLGLSVNLSRKAYEGGALQLRDRVSKRILQEIDNRGRGDAVLFPISQRFEHRVTAVRGDAVRTAYAGWFLSEPGTELPETEVISLARPCRLSESALDARIRIPREVAYSRKKRAATLYHAGTNCCYELDSVGARIWECLAKFGSMKKSLARIIAEYQVPRPMLTRDILRLAGELRAHRLIQLGSADLGWGR